MGDIDVAEGRPPFRGRDQAGIQTTGARVAFDLAGEVDGFWVHLDLVVGEEQTAPVPNGITWTELAELTRPLLSSPVFAGFSLGCYNPDKDRDGENGRRIIELVGEVLGSEGLRGHS